MKKLLLPFLLCGTCVVAQTGNVGINTPTPTEVLDINGTLRIRKLPTPGQTNAIKTKPDGTGSTSYDQTFTATKQLVVDANGIVGTQATGGGVLFSHTTIPAVTNSNTATNITTSTLRTETITLTQIGYVTINFSVASANISTTAGGIISDGRARVIRNSVVVNGIRYIAQTQNYTNSSSTGGTIASGIFYNTGSVTLQLPAGTHTILLQGVIFNDAQITFGGNFEGQFFQAIVRY